ncbi:hypothetical protein JADG_009806 [Aureobasidium aubasidani]|nr:hypothetical protein JADG_009806 [Aureobasidium pullulans]
MPPLYTTLPSADQDVEMESLTQSLEGLVQARRNELHHGTMRSDMTSSAFDHRGFPNDRSTRYVMNRYLRRWFANTFGPPLLTLTYSLIVRYYLCVPPVNGVIDPPLISAGFVFYAWLIFSIFALDWAKSALAGFEAWALMDPRFAPPTALHLMWHTDRAWGSVSGWRDAIVPLCMGVRHRFSKQPTRRVARGPAGLWWFLAFSSFLFYAAIPLSSLTMEMEPAFKRSTRTISILGANETTFDTGLSNLIAEQANNHWRTGNPTTPYGETVLYGPIGVGNGSDKYYWDTINDACLEDVKSPSNPAHQVTFFSGPKVPERAHGSAWGLLTNLSCSIISPTDQSFRLLKVYDIDNWTAPAQRARTSTFTVAKAAATFLAQCAPSNIVSSAVGQKIGTISSNKAFTLQSLYLQDTTGYGCCAQCASDENCAGFAQAPNGGACYYITTDGRCDVDQSWGDRFHYYNTNGLGYQVGNGQCGWLGAQAGSPTQ